MHTQPCPPRTRPEARTAPPGSTQRQPSTDWQTAARPAPSRDLTPQCHANGPPPENRKAARSLSAHHDASTPTTKPPHPAYRWDAPGAGRSPKPAPRSSTLRSRANRPTAAPPTSAETSQGAETQGQHHRGNTRPKRPVARDADRGQRSRAAHPPDARRFRHPAPSERTPYPAVREHGTQGQRGVEQLGQLVGLISRRTMVRIHPPQQRPGGTTLLTGASSEPRPLAPARAGDPSRCGGSRKPTAPRRRACGQSGASLTSALVACEPTRWA